MSSVLAFRSLSCTLPPLVFSLPAVCVCRSSKRCLPPLSRAPRRHSRRRPPPPPLPRRLVMLFRPLHQPPRSRSRRPRAPRSDRRRPPRRRPKSPSNPAAQVCPRCPRHCHRRVHRHLHHRRRLRSPPRAHSSRPRFTLNRSTRSNSPWRTRTRSVRPRTLPRLRMRYWPRSTSWSRRRD